MPLARSDLSQITYKSKSTKAVFSCNPKVKAGENGTLKSYLNPMRSELSKYTVCVVQSQVLLNIKSNLFERHDGDFAFLKSIQTQIAKSSGRIEVLVPFSITISLNPTNR